MQNVLVFLDEFGNTQLNVNKSGTTSHFVFTAVVADAGNRDKLLAKQKEVSRKYFQGSPLKSSRIKNDKKGFAKRLNILAELLEEEFLVFAYVVNKSKLTGEGLKYKKSFYKYFNRLFLQQFPENYTSFAIFADKLGYPEFQRSLTDYLDKHVLQRNLFTPDRFYQLVDDKTEEPLVQLADFFAGCVGKIYCSSHVHQNAIELFEPLSERLSVEFFPYEKINYLADRSDEFSALDSEISDIALNSALNFIENPPKGTPFEQLEAVRYLLIIYKSNPEKLVESYELVKRIQKVNYNFSEQNLRQVIQALRDKGVIIASIQGKSGYKIPYKSEDIFGFYNRYLGNIVPMLKRIQIVDQKLKKNSLNRIKIMEEIPEFQLLSQLLQVLEIQKTNLKK